MKPTSLARRAISMVVIVELLCAVGLSGTAVWHEARSRLHAFDVMLQGRSDSLLGAVQDAEDPEDNVTIDPAELNLPPAHVYAVYNQGGRLLGTSRNAPAPLIARGSDGFRTERVNGDSYRVFQREALRIIDRAENDGVGLRRPVTILYAVPTGEMWHEIRVAAGFYIGVSLLLVCLTAAILVLLTRRLLQPVQALATAATNVDSGSLAFTPPARAASIVELRPLCDALEGTLGRLRLAFQLEHRFVGDAAHELKTAIAVVRSSIQVLMMRPRTADEYRSGLERILNDNERVETLVSRMLTLARLEEHPERVPEPVSVTESVQDALEILDSFAHAHGVALKATLAPGVKARLTPEAARVLVSNLVVNAVQHSAPGAVVSVVLRDEPAAQPNAILEVQDSGTGVAAENLPHVFDRFFREDSSRSRETGGAGLGLAICKSIVEAADGHIEMQSVRGQGTVVRASFNT